MKVYHHKDCQEFLAGDATHLREILHPDKMDIALRYSLAHAVVKPGETSFKHALKTSEIYIILEGKGLMVIDKEAQEVTKGHVVYIPPNAVQCIENIGTEDLIFYCIVDPAWREEDEIVFESESKP